MRSQFWGYHLMLDCAGCQGIDNYDNIYRWIKQLVKDIDMVASGEPQIVLLGLKETHLAGYTAVQLIETSCITGHFCDNTGEAYIDVFSCKEFDKEVAKACVKQFFNPTSMRETYLIRQA